MTQKLSNEFRVTMKTPDVHHEHPSFDKSRNGFKWSESELEQLIHEAQDMKTLHEIAAIHKRAVSSVRYKLLQYAIKMHTVGIQIDSIMKLLPLKKKDIMDYITKQKEEGETTEYKKFDPETGLIEYPQKYIPYENRGILLFDLNGTLCHRTKCFKKEIYIRPCVRELSKLKNFYRLGIYTSVMRSNALEIIRMVEEKCGRIFDRNLIFTREHTFPFSPYEQQTFNIPSYKTKKSLAQVLPEIFNGNQSGDSKNISVKIIDDEIVKIHEKDHAIIIPSWDGYSEDVYLKDLVAELTSNKHTYSYDAV
jgi:hypothetical protein